MAKELFYQAIMRVPGLTGSRYQDRGRDLYYKLGAPYGAYEGNLKQNSWLLNQIRNNNYFSTTQPWNKTSATTTPAAADPRQGIADATLNRVEPSPSFSDVMPQETWNSVFDEWTRNFANEYVLPEWQEATYKPAIEDMTRTLGNMNQQIGLTGAWRSGTANNSLARAAEESIKQEEQLRKDYQSDIASLRDAVMTNWANPLYQSQMKRYTNAPWRNLNLGEISNEAGINANTMVNNLASQYGVTDTSKLNALIGSLGDWDPSSKPDTTLYDWTVPKADLSLIEQYR